MPLLAKYFLEEANQEFNKKIEGMSGEAIKSLLKYHWPGNVRELRNGIRKAVLLTDSNYTGEIDLPADIASNIEKSDLLSDLDKDTSLQEIIRKATEKLEKEVIKKALDQANNNKTRAAKILKIDRMTLYSKIKSLGL